MGTGRKRGEGGDDAHKSPGGLAQLARAPALQAGGHRFDSDILHQNARSAFQEEGPVEDCGGNPMRRRKVKVKQRSSSFKCIDVDTRKWCGLGGS